ncbi:hypothetical protein MGN70_003021 [Eutypa lata]|nr:hypothetical protein MGN70_003021 [Eutypa lata]
MASDTKSAVTLQKHAATTDDVSVTKEPATMEGRRELPPLLRNLPPEELKALEKKLVRKIDIRLLPTMILIYIMNYLDRFVLSLLTQVTVMLNIGTGTPSVLLGSEALKRIWDLDQMSFSGAAHNFGGLLVTRFLLGFVEAAFYPGALATLSACGSMLSGAFSGLIAAGITSGMDGVRGLLAWRWLFIIEGAITVFIALGAIFILPDFPANTKWLTDQERELAMWRLEVDAAGEEDWKSSSSQPLWDGFRMIIRDPKNWILTVIVYGAASSISINAFFPTVVASFGKDRTTTLLLTAPPYLLACIVCAGVAWSADRMKERYWHTVVPLALSLVGFIISAAAESLGPRYFGAMIMLPGIYTGFNMTMVWTANTMYRPAAKRAAAVAFVNAVSTLCSIYGSYLYPNDAGPRFVLAFSVNAGMALIAIIASTVLHFVLKRENRKLELKEQEAERAGLPDTIGKGFRYLC